MSKGGRIATTLVLFVLVAVGVYFGVTALLYTPPTVTYTAQGGQVNVTLETVGSYGLAPHPTWVSYLTLNPENQWVHTTIWQVPAHTQVNVTIYQFDSGSPLRNQQLGQVTGTFVPGRAKTAVPTTAGEAELNGKVFSALNANAGNGVGHTFSIPTLRISVPLWGNNGNANLCAVAPCSPTSKAYPHNEIKFSFMSPGPGTYPWQCFVPCALGFLYGNGGPMSTVGYMGGFMKVV